MEFAGVTDIGRHRRNNQDRWAADADQSLFIVADGVAGSTDGELAAALVTELLPTYVARHLKPDVEGEVVEIEPEALGRAIEDFCADFRGYASTDPRAAGATSTVVAAVVTGSRLLVAHLGDSRAYLLRDQELQCLTRDHNLLRELIDAGKVDVADADRHPARNTLTRHVAMLPRALPDSSAVGLEPGDRILLCSDGLYSVVDKPSLERILASHPVPEDACTALVAAANEAGGPDNITAIVINV
ncbi:PP2C family protein-serine/threonine phosphatase [Mycobacterium bourgelatii]|uniref:PP2C family protein-serine/threonine phosphatase n=1 Tax=Mycobacterium bourgelatii TaxID=1273442 RepID=UPI0013D47977|nr:protein phosphatase 2C domain-containing protein [Mycobacterium bourgelatii]MCV6976400.1 serine/threonine-protein phosphatase [Mycobacterium bourgelatii]